MHYNVFSLSCGHMIKVYATGMLGTISLFPQNLVHIKYPFLKLWYENWYRKVRQLLLNETKSSYWKAITKCDRSLLQSASGVTKYVRFYKVWQTVITKWDVTVLVKGEFIRIFQLIKELNSMISNHHNKLQFKKLKFIDCHYILFRA